MDRRRLLLFYLSNEAMQINIRRSEFLVVAWTEYSPIACEVTHEFLVGIIDRSSSGPSDQRVRGYLEQRGTIFAEMTFLGTARHRS